MLDKEIHYLYLVHNVLAQHDLVGFCHGLTCQSSLCCTKQGIIVQALVDSPYQIG